MVRGVVSLLVEKTDPRADMAVLFMHNEGEGVWSHYWWRRQTHGCADMAVYSLCIMKVRGSLRHTYTLQLGFKFHGYGQFKSMYYKNAAHSKDPQL